MKNVISASTKGCYEEAYLPNNLSDFAISTTDHITNNSSIKTGRSHPYRSSISHLYTPIPASSNINKDATKDLYRKSADFEKSPLLQKGNIDDEKSTIEKGQGKPVSDEG
ncbi:hypothetical protein N7452_009116 [Penicillium brevicompactum]|uniref:Uncharacterized protein n=1 Tax=Penicillium brevicompactum TaxID=5074 RepID=A0A9W9Q818_PENBR|nr:hypothetical protein N7452_009116 [Penicillium brevicompactum]